LTFFSMSHLPILTLNFKTFKESQYYISQSCITPADVRCWIDHNMLRSAKLSGSLQSRKVCLADVRHMSGLQGADFLGTFSMYIRFTQSPDLNILTGFCPPNIQGFCQDSPRQKVKN